MDPALRQAWTQIVTADDYDEHMASIGQAQAAAELTYHLVRSASLADGSSITIAGAGTGQMFDYLAPAVFRPYRLTCADLNPAFLSRLRERLALCGLEANIVVDDIERTSLEPRPDFLLATLLLEHIEWQRGIEAFARLSPKTCGIIIQENPPGMSAPVTPGRRLPPSLAKAVETAHPQLAQRDRLIAAMATQSYALRDSSIREVSDGKRLAGLLFGRRVVESAPM